MESVWTMGRGEGPLHQEFGWLVKGLEWAGEIIDVLAILLLLIGAIRFIVGVVQAELSRDSGVRFRGLNRERVELARYILSGLELLIVADIIRTALSLALSDLVFLGVLVLIRSVISFFLDRELEQLRQELSEPPLVAPHRED
ncbi:DUF1622 domain-containing protein [Rubellimicrobium roseum]|uniref:DUF1622 domain-containing protein n=1 Tax=Rubellimicrobium roseum TaxID=687525 RepID=A0A5C4NIG6_9RHOB|nr:DUF1622 domain-containing protein [Rubellimicrobium roseum]TNC73730.1 DUF1622 domain-containing protein [Rubellimicrobium roseum]